MIFFYAKDITQKKKSRVHMPLRNTCSLREFYFPPPLKKSIKNARLFFKKSSKECCLFV